MVQTASGDGHRIGTLHIQSVSRLTNLSVDTIRAWEKRYAAVRPQRGPAGQRLFSSDDVERLVLLRMAVNGGDAISKVASLSTPDLRQLVWADGGPADPDGATLERLHARVRKLDATQLCRELLNAGLTTSAVEFGDTIVSRLMILIEQRAATLHESVIQEQVVSQCVHSIAAALFGKYETNRGAPMLFMTLPGEKHALPALLAGLVAAEAGYTALYVGTEISPAHVPTLVRDTGAAAIGVYLSTWDDEQRLNVDELRQNVGSLPLFFGGNIDDPQIGATRNYLEFFGKLTHSPFAVA